MTRMRLGRENKADLYVQLGTESDYVNDERVAVCSDEDTAKELMDAWNDKHETNPQPGDWETT